MAAGFLIDAGATMLCPHGGQVTATAPAPRVRLGGMPAVTASSPLVIAGCTFTPTPDAAARYVSTAVRIRSGGAPLVLSTSQAVTAPNGFPVTVAVQQLRVKGT